MRTHAEISVNIEVCPPSIGFYGLGRWTLPIGLVSKRFIGFGVWKEQGTVSNKTGLSLIFLGI